jgi:carbamoylphosphate synthase large subunit
VRGVLDKAVNLDLAERIGVPCPKRFDLESIDEVPRMVEAIGLPVVLKNPRPEVAPEAGGLPFRFVVVRELPELQRRVADLSDRTVKPLFQEYASGKTQNLCCFAIEGDTVAIHQYVSLRRGSHAGIFRQIVALDPELEHHTRRILQELKWSGVAHIQFVTQQASGKKWYMETNGRFWASTQGSINAGWNFPLWSYEFFAEGKRPDVPPIQIGSQTVYRKADLETLINYLRGYQSPTFYTDPGRWWAIRKHLGTLHPRVNSDVWSWTDPGPGLWDFMKFGKTLFSALLGRMQGRNGATGTTGH